MFRNFYSMITKSNPKEIFRPLHRWTIDYSYESLNRKIDMANEDNCGPCGQYSLKKLNENNIKIDMTKSNISNIEYKYKYSPFKSSHIDYLIYYENKN